MAGAVVGALVVTGPSIWTAITNPSQPSTAITSTQPPQDPGTPTEPPQVSESVDPPPRPGQNPISSAALPPPITPDPFPAGVRDLGRTTVRANGFAYEVFRAEAREAASGPEVVVDVEIRNEVFQQPTDPFGGGFETPVLRVRGVTVPYEPRRSFPPLAIGKSTPEKLIFSVDDSFQWNDAVLVFPVFGQGVDASVPLGDTGQWVTLPPGALSISGSLTSGQARLDFYPKGLYRSDVALSDGVHDKGFDSGGLQPGKGSLLIRFNLTLTPDTTNVSISKDNFSLTLPDDRVIRPDHAPILVSPNQSSYQGLIIATQVDTPAAGTYKLTFTCGVLNGYGQPGQPVTIPFTVAAPS